MPKIILLYLLTLTIFSCEENIPEEIKPCGEKVFIRMFVRDTLNLPYFFSRSETLLNDTVILKYEDLARPSGLIVITDDEINKLADTINHLTVKAYKGADSLILTEKFEITKDSCHVIYKSGPKYVTIYQ
ncbi:MAG: hypothetical protein IPL63_18125 [Saprospiraceae bacterium]|nr:hypothetical protein [Saprospiraceae bacterium]MBK6566457.1 hypothetical protein [Saprospiraceae bacterium]MBK6783496.1 hypothetical protein [Saprospiraceae bacterium]MBK7524398.1 hypothetical protein [Saprospiraceae bacterium]MBK8080920.1 hypothetical protein [Saprospiraceae bacterium]